MENNLPKRKHPRLKEYDYSSDGVYFVTICTENKQHLLSRPTLTDVVCAYKSLTTRECKKVKPIDKLFQTSFYEHIVREGKDYEIKSQYIHENPLKWQFDELYCEE